MELPFITPSSRQPMLNQLPVIDSLFHFLQKAQIDTEIVILM